MSNWILLLWGTGGMIGLGSADHWVDYRGHITAQEMKSKESCVYALKEIKKVAPTIDGYCIPK